MPTSDEAVRRSLLHLLRRQGEESTRFGAVFGQAHGLHHTDLTALAAIVEATVAGAPLGPGGLADALGLGRPATSALLDRLERAGHVERSHDPADGRRSLIRMRPGAEALARELFGPLGDAYRAVMDERTPQELAVVERFLADIVRVTIDARLAVAT